MSRNLMMPSRDLVASRLTWIEGLPPNLITKLIFGGYKRACGRYGMSLDLNFSKTRDVEIRT